MRKDLARFTSLSAALLLPGGRPTFSPVRQPIETSEADPDSVGGPIGLELGAGQKHIGSPRLESSSCCAR